MREREDSRTPPTCLSGQSTWKMQPLSELIHAEEAQDSQGSALHPVLEMRCVTHLQGVQVETGVRQATG